MEDEILKFVCWITGHDEDTIHQMWNDYYSSPSQNLSRVQPEVVVKTADEWVSIKERLPEIGTEVIVYCPKCTVRKVTALARFIRYEEATDYYWDNVYGGSNVHVMGSVTHWKPMQSKPK